MIKPAAHIRLIAFWICAAGFLLFPLHSAFAEPSILLAQGLNFGRIIPRNNNLTIILDALGDGLPTCSPENDCITSGGHPAAFYFYDFGSLNIRLNFPSDARLYTDTGRQGAIIRNMHMRSNVEAFTDGNRQKAYIGGELLTGSPVYGETLTGTIRVDITTY